jgi:F-type H+-transporting ATPase subunit b
VNLITQFGEAVQPSGIAALGINLQGFLFQLITFVLVLLLLRKYVYGKLIETLDERRNAVIDSLDNAKKAAADLEKTNEKTAVLIKAAQEEASQIIALAQKESAKVIEDAEIKASKKADHLLEQAEARIDSDIAIAKAALRHEMTELVVMATEKVLRTKLDDKTDKTLVKNALKEIR